MTVAALPGNVRLRAFQLGKETTFGTAVDATRRLPWSMTPALDPHWTFPVADTGTLDEAIAPYRLSIDADFSTTGSTAFNDLPYLFAGTVKGGVTPSGGGPYTWAYAPAYTSQDIFEIFSAEWGDEVTADQYRYSDCIINRLQLQFPEDLSPVQSTADWYGASVTYPHTRQALSVDFQPNWVYAADTSLYIDSTAVGIEGTQLLNTLHGSTITITNNIDKKRFQNGSNTRFQVAGYGRGLRTFEASFDFAKSSVGVAEVVNWLAASPVERFVGIKTISPAIAGGGTPYSLDIRFPGFWFTNAAGTYATANTTNQLMMRGFIDQTLAYPFSISVVNALSAL